MNPKNFIEILTQVLAEDAVVVAGNGTASIALFQAATIKKGQRMFMNSGTAAMGYDLPAAIGACLANEKKNVICITGDGSIQMNIQELQTIVHNKLPIKIFVLNNGGYSSIRQTQDNYFEGRYVGSDSNSGVSCPDIMKIAKAYNINHGDLVSEDFLKDGIEFVLSKEGPFICEVLIDRDYKFEKYSYVQ